MEPGKSEAALLITDYINTSLITKKQVLIDTTERHEQSEKEKSTESNEHIEETAGKVELKKDISTEFPECYKFGISEGDIFLGALIIKKRSEFGIFNKNYNKYNLIFQEKIAKKYNISTWKSAGIEVELKKHSKIVDSEEWKNKFPEISID